MGNKNPNNITWEEIMVQMRIIGRELCTVQSAPSIIKPIAFNSALKSGLFDQ